ncbi:AI-2E family transporter [Opitutaceae bacterium]
MSPEPDSKRVLTPGQRRLVGIAAGVTAFLAIAAAIVLGFFVFGRLLGVFSGVLWPLAAAGILALILRPVVDTLQNRLSLRRVTAVVLLYGAFILVVGGLLVLITPPLIEQFLDFIAFIPTFWNDVVAYGKIHYPEWVGIAERQLANPTIKQMVDNLTAEAQGMLSQALPSLKAAGVGALTVFSFVTHLAIIPIYLFFFLLSKGDPTGGMAKHLPFFRPGVRDDIIFLVREFIAIVVSFFRGQLLIGLLMGCLLAVGFSIVGLRFGLFIGLTLGILNIVPYLGTIIGLSIALPLAFLQPEGGWALVGLVLAVFCVVQLIEGWFLTPKIMGDRTGLHPVTIIVAIFFWGTAFSGVIGMILAIPLTAFFVTAWRLARHKYFKPAT